MQAELFDDAEVISTYTAEQAVEDGILVEVGRAGNCPVYITRNCMVTLELEEDDEKRREVVELCLHALQQPDREDDDYRCLRALTVDDVKVWAILDGQGVTIMRPEDY